MIKPKKLNPGDKVAAVTLSWGGPGTFPHRYEIGKQQLEQEFGVQVVEMPNTLKDAKWVYENPQARTNDLLQAFSDPDIKAIISTIGGDDSMRILPYLDLDIIRNNPKIFLGYSDTTVSHFACFKAGLTSYYGPSIMAGFGENGGLFPYMIESVRNTLFSSEPIGEIRENQEDWTVENLDWKDPANQNKKRKRNPCTGWNFLQGKGVHQGHLMGGCFEVLDWLRGTEFWPSLDDWKGAILFIETSEEAPSPTLVERGMRAYAAMGILAVLAGIIYGRPGGDVSTKDFLLYDQAIMKIIRDEQGITDLPIITKMDFGHTDPMLILPYGIKAEINCDSKTFSIIENCVIK